MDKANICKYLLALKHIQCPFYVFKYICISLFVDLGCNFSHLSHCWIVIYFGVNHWKHLLWGLVCNHLITFLNDPIRPKNVVICLLVLECYYVIRLVGIKQIPSFLLSYNRLKRFFFLPWEGWEIWFLPGWGEEFEPELSSLFSKIDMFYFLVWRCLKVWSFQKCKCLRSCQGGQEGCWNFKLIKALLRTLKRRLSQLKF